MVYLDSRPVRKNSKRGNRTVKIFFMVCLCLVIVGSQSHSNERPLDSDRYFNFSTPEVHEIPDLGIGKMGKLEVGLEHLLFPASSQLLDKDRLPSVPVNLWDLVNIGKTIWEIVNSNRPVVDINVDQATVVPKGISDWQTLQGWRFPATHVYRVTAKNLYGGTVVDCIYRILYNYGGNINGQGHFLNRVTVLPSEINVAWAYTFKMTATIPSIYNVGSSSDPVAAAELLVRWKIDTVVKHLEQANDYVVEGNGGFLDRGSSIF